MSEPEFTLRKTGDLLFEILFRADVLPVRREEIARIAFAELDRGARELEMRFYRMRGPPLSPGITFLHDEQA
jgi:hypothetical protein